MYVFLAISYANTWCYNALSKLWRLKKNQSPLTLSPSQRSIKKIVSKWTAFVWKKNHGSLMKKWMIILPFFSSMIYNEKDIAFSVIIW